MTMTLIQTLTQDIATDLRILSGDLAAPEELTLDAVAKSLAANLRRLAAAVTSPKTDSLELTQLANLFQQSLEN